MTYEGYLYSKGKCCHTFKNFLRYLKDIKGIGRLKALCLYKYYYKKYIIKYYKLNKSNMLIKL